MMGRKPIPRLERLDTVGGRSGGARLAARRSIRASNIRNCTLMNEPLDYRSAGVDLETYAETISQIGPLLRRTYTPRVIDWKNGFAGLFRLDDQIGLLSRAYRDPVLVASTDGVGTKLKLAFATGRHSTVGIDLVAMSVNDCLCAGAEPLDFPGLRGDEPRRSGPDAADRRRGSATGASKRSARFWEARRRFFRTFTRRANTTWPGFASAWSSASTS